MAEDDFAEIDILPDEILEAVFGYLSIHDVKTRIAVVSKRWYRVSKSYSLIKNVEFGPSITTEVAIEILREAPLLSYLKLCSRNDVNALLAQIPLFNTKLEKLKICSNKDARYTEVEHETLLHCVRALRNLKYLTLKRVSFDNPEDAFSLLGDAAKKLVALNLNHSIQLDTESLFALVRGLPKLKELRIYCISFNRIGSVTPYTDAPVEELSRKMYDTLQILKLNMLGITGEVFQALSSLPNLRVLHLYRMVMVHDESLMLLRRLQKLQKLMVTIPRSITSQCWSETLGSSTMALLTMVTVSNSYTLDDMVLKTIADNCPVVEELGFPGCRGISDVGVSAVVVKCRRLLRMNLFSTKSVVTEAFKLIPLFLPQLELLIFRAVDRTETVFPEEVRAMTLLNLKTTYRYP